MARGTLRQPSKDLPVAQRSVSRFGDLLRERRIAAGLTQEALAERAGLSAHGIQKLERGVTRPYRDTLQRLLLALRLAPDDEAELRVAAGPAPRELGKKRPQLLT